VTSKERELLAQLIDMRVRDRILRRENENLRATVGRLRAELKYCSRSALKKRLDHALNELDAAKKLNSPRLSREEWQMIKDFRGNCT
jgi:hypothetical protein